MKYIFFYYNKCSTCIKAKKILNEKNINYSECELSKSSLSKNDIENILNINDDINKLFNVRGNLFKELNLKEKINDLTKEEKINLLIQNGMLVKRPILLSDTILIIGFNESEYKTLSNE